MHLYTTSLAYYPGTSLYFMVKYPGNTFTTEEKKKFNLVLLSLQTWYPQMTRKGINVKGIPGNKSYLYNILTPLPTKFEGKEKPKTNKKTLKQVHKKPPRTQQNALHLFVKET